MIPQKVKAETINKASTPPLHNVNEATQQHKEFQHNKPAAATTNQQQHSNSTAQQQHINNSTKHFRRPNEHRPTNNERTNERTHGQVTDNDNATRHPSSIHSTFRTSIIAFQFVQIVQR